MGELVFIGLGLHDDRGITLRGLEEAQSADVVFAELYTSGRPGASLESVERLLGREVRKLSRAEVEDGRVVLEAAQRRKVALLVVGDPMMATTHVDLRLRAHAANLRTRIIHGVSILTAAAGALGLQAYKFGRTTTIPFPAPGFEPTSPLEAILGNHRAGLHTLVLLDVREDSASLSPEEGIAYLVRMARAVGTTEIGAHTVTCVLSRAGSPDVHLLADRMGALAGREFGPPPHCLVIPGPLHFLEKEALVAFAGAPQDL